ncbi:outer membrane receptor protein involved in Fe transport [Sphingomonas jinjuensis]|uniref:Outer membrane receptor protein involved in Fe transport n=1 Tax=Sphingomonas jinjuensis TaxID=535907 RepID=A0A840FFJ1_9SPHN|nr:TonB-dependent receptor [Sphingomonas jinjuensis]MBB4155661.1 outer membrane receptor protein involved in Fe transport [Sphingomonas jinjuensis]
MICTSKIASGVGLLTLALIWTAPAGAQVVGPSSGTSIQPNPRTDPTDPEPPQPQAADAAATGLGDIVVTANRREQNLQDVGATVQALTGEDLAKAGINDVSRLEQLAPGIVFAKGGNDAKIALRGANSNSTFADNTSIVGVFVDGVYKPRASQQSRAFFDVSRLEVLRGPQGTLYGRNTLGGAINLYTNGPDLSKPGVSASVDTRYSRFNDFRTESVVNYGVSDEFGMRLAVLTESSDGWVKNLIGRNLGIADTLSLRGSLLAKPAPGVSFVLRVTHIRENGNPAGMFAINGACRTTTANGLTDPYGATIDCQNPRRGSGGTPRFDLIDGVAGLSNKDKRTVIRDYVHDDRLRETNLTLEGNADLGPVGLKSITSYTNYTSLLGNDSDYSSNPHGREWVEENNESFSQELQLESQWKGPLQATVGAYYSTDHLLFSYSSLRHTLDNLAARPNATSTNGVVLPVQTGTPLVSLANVINSASNNTQFIDSSYLGFFGEARLSLAHWLRLIGGARYNTETKRALNGNAPYVGAINPATPPDDPRVIFPYNDATATARSRVRAVFNNVTWRAGVEADLADDVLVYGTASTGFLSGVMNQNGTVTQPQKSRSFEAGLKSRFWDRRAELNLAIYDVRYSALATTFQIPNPANVGSFITLSSNGGILKARGVEVSGAVLPVDAWRISFGGSYIDATYGRFGINLPGGFQVINGAVPASRFIDLAGQRPPYTPKFTVSVATSYAFDLGFGTLTPQVQFRYSDSYFAHGGLPFDRSGFQPSFTQTDARLGFSPTDGNWSIEGFVENIEDEMLNQRTQTGGDGLQQANWGLPRNYGVRAKFSF